MKLHRVESLVLALALALSLALPASAYSQSAVDAALTDTAACVCAQTAAPRVGSVGGDWAVLGLARSGCAVPENYYQSYYAAVEKTVQACGGVLDKRKYTEYSRVITALSSIGKDARSVAGYDLTTPLGDYERTIWQGINGPVWALIALDSRSYPMPRNPDAVTQATRQMYVDRILAGQLSGGGWSQSGSVPDPDMTGMALQALAKYQSQPAVKTAVDAALSRMSEQQSSDGGFSSWGTANFESCVQMIVALTELGIPLSDSRFVKNGNTLADNLLTFYRKGVGFAHTQDGTGSDQMATEQGLYGLAAMERAAKKQNSLYRMGDAAEIETGSVPGAGQGLSGKNADVKAAAVVSPGKTFADISGHQDQIAVEALAARGILNGKSDAVFDPDASMTRAQFTAAVVRALGLTPRAVEKFTDVKAGDWCAGYVGTAYTYGIVNGTSDTAFTPGGTITRQQAAAMVARAARLCGMNTDYSAAAARDVLAQFSDYVKCSAFALEALAFCYDQGILDESALTIQPRRAITRGEVAGMLYHLLNEANLL